MVIMGEFMESRVRQRRAEIPKGELKELKEASTQKETENKPDYRDADVLHCLHWVDGLSTRRMAEELRVSQYAVRYWMRKNGISKRSLSEAREIYPKIPFSGDPVEGASMLGFRAGDGYACKLNKNGNTMAISTSTTHPAMRKFMRNVFGKYGHYHEYPFFNKKTNQYEFHSYVLVDAESFDFLRGKPKEVPKGDLFWSFLASYAICEGVWDIARADDWIQIHFRLQTTNPELLKQVNDRLEEYGFHPNFGLVRKVGKESEGAFRSTKDLYGVSLTLKDEVVRLAEKLLDTYTLLKERCGIDGHEEKIAWKKLILEVKDVKYWVDVRDKVIVLREKIEREKDKCVKEAEEAYKAKRNGRINGAKSE